MKDSDAGSVRFSVRGPFAVTDQDGQTLTPRGKKSQGILALLLMSKNLRRSRGLLKDKLWSDRGPDQAAASLRFALTEIRKALGVHRHVLGADRTDVWLEPACCVIENDTGFGGVVEDLFEGLDVRDPEFETWLASLRANDTGLTDPQPAPASGPALPRVGAQTPATSDAVVVFQTFADPQGTLALIDQGIAEAAATSLREQIDAQIYVQNAPLLVRRGVLVGLHAFANPAARSPAQRFGTRVTMEALEDGRLLWSRVFGIHADLNILSPGNDLHAIAAQIVSAAQQIIDARIAHLDGLIAGSNLKALIGVHKAFTIRPGDALEAETFLQEAFAETPRGVYLAWLAQLHAIAFVERLRLNTDLREQAQECAAKALELEPHNSHVLAANANVKLVFERDMGLARLLASQAIELNPCNAMAWCTLGHVQLYTGEIEAAFVSSSHAQALAAGSALQFWTDFQMSLACAMSGRLEQARVLARLSSTARPEFRAALRYSIAFHAAADQLHQAAHAADLLTRVEHDFTPERLAEDPEYPIGLMRKTRFWLPERFRDLPAVDAASPHVD